MPGTPAFNLAHQRGAPTHLALKADRNVPRKAPSLPLEPQTRHLITSLSSPLQSVLESCSAPDYIPVPDSTASVQAPVTSHLATASK